MLIQNEYFNLEVRGEKVVLRLIKTGFPLKSFDMIARTHPRLKINSFATLRQALTDLTEEHIIGTWLPAIDVAVTADKMTAEIIINMSIEEFNDNKPVIKQQIEEALNRAGVVYGRQPFEVESFVPGRSIICALGTPPEKGADAHITYFEIPDKKPVIREDGSADYYEMNFVTPVDEGDWLGEKIPPQEGIDGSDVFGNVLPAQKGADAKIYYDRKSVIEELEEDKTVLRALHGGALESINGVISVGKQLVINGDVGPETGSITFDGAVTVFGTVLADYSVKATGDISIEGSEGVTNAKEIQSAEGDIYIKGGVFGGGMTIVEAQGDIFIKHANNCKLYGQNIHVGLYLLGCEVIAEYVFVDRNRGKIIGGHIEALFHIESAYAGNHHERPTTLHVKGINKEALYKEIQEKAQDLKERQEVITRLEQHTAQFGKVAAGPQAAAYKKTLETIEINRKAAVELDKEIQLGLHKIKQATSEKIGITREAYPGVIIQIGSKSSLLHDSKKGTFEILGGVLNV